jgi:hypothetical protein
MAFLQKPIDAAHLVTAVETLLTEPQMILE